MAKMKRVDRVTPRRKWLEIKTKNIVAKAQSRRGIRCRSWKIAIAIGRMNWGRSHKNEDESSETILSNFLKSVSLSIARSEVAVEGIEGEGTRIRRIRRII